MGPAAAPDPAWQLIGTLWPLFGLGLVAVAAVAARGRLRWWLLYAGPLLVVAPCYLYADSIAYNGNLLFVLIFMLILIGLMIYYPVLMLVTVYLLLDTRRQDPGQGRN